MYSLIDTHSRDNKKHFISVVIMVCCARPEKTAIFAWPAKPSRYKSRPACNSDPPMWESEKLMLVAFPTSYLVEKGFNWENNLLLGKGSNWLWLWIVIKVGEWQEKVGNHCYRLFTEFTMDYFKSSNKRCWNNASNRKGIKRHRYKNTFYNTINNTRVYVCRKFRIQWTSMIRQLDNSEHLYSPTLILG